MKEKSSTEKFLEAFDESETKEVSDICRRANLSRVTFYHHFKTDKNFKLNILERQRKNLDQQIAAITA